MSGEREREKGGTGYGQVEASKLKTQDNARLLDVSIHVGPPPTYSSELLLHLGLQRHLIHPALLCVLLPQILAGFTRSP